MSESNDSLDNLRKRQDEIFAKIRANNPEGGEVDFQALEKKGVLTRSDVEFLWALSLSDLNAEMPSSDPQERLHQILGKITTYQHSLPSDRAVELDELARGNVLSADDQEFMKAHSVTYKPHRLADYHAMDMLHMPTENGGCVFIGPGGPPLKKRTHRCAGFQTVMEEFLKLPNPDLLMHIEFTEDEGVGVSPGFISFGFKTPEWRERIDIVREVAAEFGVVPFQDAEVQERWTLTFRLIENPSITATVAFALLTRGCGIKLEEQIIYSAGALDVAESEE